MNMKMHNSDHFTKNTHGVTFYLSYYPFQSAKVKATLEFSFIRCNVWYINLSWLLVGSFKCPEGHRKCASGHCVANRKWCDFQRDCPDNSDEADCGKLWIFITVYIYRKDNPKIKHMLKWKTTNNCLRKQLDLFLEHL